MQLIAGEHLAFSIQVKDGYFKSALLQSAVEDREAALFVDQQLQVCAGAIDEDKSIALRNLTAQFIGDDPAKLVEAFAHIGGRTGERLTSVSCS